MLVLSGISSQRIAREKRKQEKETRKHETARTHLVAGCVCAVCRQSRLATAVFVCAKLDTVISDHTCSMVWLAVLAH